MQKRNLLLACAGLFLAAASAHAEWPERTLQMVVPFPAGGTVNAVARRLAQSLSTELKQSVAVINKDGASGTIGVNAVASSTPDGYTLGFSPDGPITVQPTLNPKVPYTADNLQPICQVFSFPYVLAVRADSDLPNLGAFVAQAKVAAVPLSYGFGGVGTGPHFAMLQLQQKSDTKFLGVPFRGDPAVAVALKGGQVDAAVLTVQTVRQLGFKALAVFADTRLPELSSTPTAKEQGLDVVTLTYAGLFAPAKLAPEATRRLAAACSTVTRGKDFREAMAKMKQTVNYMDSEKFESVLRSDTVIKRRLIEASGIRRE